MQCDIEILLRMRRRKQNYTSFTKGNQNIGWAKKTYLNQLIFETAEQLWTHIDSIQSPSVETNI